MEAYAVGAKTLSLGSSHSRTPAFTAYVNARTQPCSAYIAMKSVKEGDTRLQRRAAADEYTAVEGEEYSLRSSKRSETKEGTMPMKYDKESKTKLPGAKLARISSS
jgi:hypothetical protein